MGALDFAGGTVVHVNAGVAALVAALVVGRAGLRAPALLPHNVPFVAARRRPALVRLVRLQRRQRAAASHVAALAFTTTMLAPAARSSSGRCST
jgi:Amt family ammonium transporter